MKLSKRISEFHHLSPQILAISINSLFSQLQHLLLKHNRGSLDGLTITITLNLIQTITNKDSLLTNNGFSFPGLFIIDKERVIQYYKMNNLLCGRSINELLRILRSIRYIKQKPGQACPVD